MNEQPLVTIYIPTSNRVDLLNRAIRSALEQEYENIEIIVVDDGSTDGTLDYLNELTRTNTKVRYLTNKEKSGACYSRNRAIQEARGEFITGLDDDDYFTPKRISEFINHWTDEENLIGLYSDTFTKSIHGKFPSSNKPKRVKQKDLLIANHIGNQIFTKTKLLTESGGFDTKLDAWQDLECWYNLLSLPNSWMKKVAVRTYVIDQSHQHERISTGKVEKIRKSFILISKKHRIKSKYKNILEAQMLAYTPSEIKLAKIPLLMLKTTSIKAAYQLAKVFISPFTKKAKTKFHKLTKIMSAKAIEDL